jgi:hypothetical protein
MGDTEYNSAVRDEKKIRTELAAQQEMAGRRVLIDAAQEQDNNRTFKVLVQHMDSARWPISGKEAASESKLCAPAVTH